MAIAELSADEVRAAADELEELLPLGLVDLNWNLRRLTGRQFRHCKPLVPRAAASSFADK